MNDLDRGISSIQARAAETFRLFRKGRRLWPELVRLDSVSRTRGPGRSALALKPALKLLLKVLSTPPSAPSDGPPESEEAHRRWLTLRGFFVGLLAPWSGPHGDGIDELRAQIEVIETCQGIAEALDAMARDFHDHALATAAEMGPAMERSLDMARTMYRGGYASELGAVMDLLRARTAAARRARAEKRAASRE